MLFDELVGERCFEKYREFLACDSLSTKQNTFNFLSTLISKYNSHTGNNNDEDSIFKPNTSSSRYSGKSCSDDESQDEESQPRKHSDGGVFFERILVVIKDFAVAELKTPEEGTETGEIHERQYG